MCNLNILNEDLEYRNRKMIHLYFRNNTDLIIQIIFKLSESILMLNLSIKHRTEKM